MRPNALFALPLFYISVLLLFSHRIKAEESELGSQLASNANDKGKSLIDHSSLGNKEQWEEEDASVKADEVTTITLSDSTFVLSYSSTDSNALTSTSNSSDASSITDTLSGISGVSDISSITDPLSGMSDNSTSSSARRTTVTRTRSRTSTSTSTEPTETPTPTGIYPTDIDLDLLFFCLNNNQQTSCLDLFRFIHFFFSARLGSDPELAAYLVALGLEPPDTDIITATSTSTTSFTFTELETSTVSFDSITTLRETSTVYVDPDDITTTVSSTSNYPITLDGTAFCYCDAVGCSSAQPFTLYSTVTQFANVVSTEFITTSLEVPVTTTVSRISVLTVTNNPDQPLPSNAAECGLILAQNNVIACLERLAYYSAPPAPTNCALLPNYLGSYEPFVSSCYKTEVTEYLPVPTTLPQEYVTITEISTEIETSLDVRIFTATLSYERTVTETDRETESVTNTATVTATTTNTETQVDVRLVTATIEKSVTQTDTEIRSTTTTTTAITTDTETQVDVRLVTAIVANNVTQIQTLLDTTTTTTTAIQTETDVEVSLVTATINANVTQVTTETVTTTPVISEFHIHIGTTDRVVSSEDLPITCIGDDGNTEYHGYISDGLVATQFHRHHNHHGRPHNGYGSIGRDGTRTITGTEIAGATSIYNISPGPLQAYLSTSCTTFYGGLILPSKTVNSNGETITLPVDPKATHSPILGSSCTTILVAPPLPTRSIDDYLSTSCTTYYGGLLVPTVTVDAAGSPVTILPSGTPNPILGSSCATVLAKPPVPTAIVETLGAYLSTTCTPLYGGLIVPSKTVDASGSTITLPADPNATRNPIIGTRCNTILINTPLPTPKIDENVQAYLSTSCTTYYGGLIVPTTTVNSDGAVITITPSARNPVLGSSCATVLVKPSIPTPVVEKLGAYLSTTCTTLYGGLIVPSTTVDASGSTITLPADPKATNSPVLGTVCDTILVAPPLPTKDIPNVGAYLSQSCTTHYGGLLVPTVTVNDAGSTVTVLPSGSRNPVLGTSCATVLVNTPIPTVVVEKLGAYLSTTCTTLYGGLIVPSTTVDASGSTITLPADPKATHNPILGTVCDTILVAPPLPTKDIPNVDAYLSQSCTTYYGGLLVPTVTVNVAGSTVTVLPSGTRNPVLGTSCATVLVEPEIPTSVVKNLGAYLSTTCTPLYGGLVVPSTTVDASGSTITLPVDPQATRNPILGSSCNTILVNTPLPTPEIEGIEAYLSTSCATHYGGLLVPSTTVDAAGSTVTFLPDATRNPILGTSCTTLLVKPSIPTPVIDEVKAYLSSSCTTLYGGLIVPSTTVDASGSTITLPPNAQATNNPILGTVCQTFLVSTPLPTTTAKPTAYMSTSCTSYYGGLLLPRTTVDGSGSTITVPDGALATVDPVLGTSCTTILVAPPPLQACAEIFKTQTSLCEICPDPVHVTSISVLTIPVIRNPIYAQPVVTTLANEEPTVTDIVTEQPAITQEPATTVVTEDPDEIVIVEVDEDEPTTTDEEETVYVEANHPTKPTGVHKSISSEVDFNSMT